MSQPKFTPWHAHKYPDVKTWTVAGANGSVASKIKDAETAALIAAAPELYEACALALRDFDAGGKHHLSSEAAGALRAALSKARPGGEGRE